MVTPSSPERPVAVVGGGIVGLCTAFHLRRAGREVVVIERGEPAAGASSGNAGSISPGSVAPVAYPGLWRDVPRMLLDPNGPLRITPRGAVSAAAWLVRFLRASSPREVRRSAEGIAPLLATTLDAHRALATAIGAPDLLRATGQLQLYPDRDAFGKDAFGWSLRRQLGVAFYELRREEILQYEPEIGPGYTHGVFLPDAGMVADPLRYGQVLAGALGDMGVRFERDDATGLEVTDGRITAVQARRARHPCGTAVISAGSWSTRLLAPLGYAIPLVNQRGYHLHFGDAGVGPRRVVAAADRKLFITPMETGLRVAGTVEIAPLDSPPDMRRARHLAEGARAVFPGLRSGPAGEWSGERPCLPDSLPVMGRAARHENLWLNFGHGHLGLTLSAASGAALADAVVSGQDTPGLAPFSHRRFG